MEEGRRGVDIDAIKISEVVKELSELDITVDAVFFPDLLFEDYPSELAAVAAMLECDEQIPVLSKTIHRRITRNAADILAIQRRVDFLQESLKR